MEPSAPTAPWLTKCVPSGAGPTTTVPGLDVVHPEKLPVSKLPLVSRLPLITGTILLELVIEIAPVVEAALMPSVLAVIVEPLEPTVTEPVPVVGASMLPADEPVTLAVLVTSLLPEPPVTWVRMPVVAP